MSKTRILLRVLIFAVILSALTGCVTNEKTTADDEYYACVFTIKRGSSREFVGKSERDTSEPAVSQATIRHNRSRWSLLFRLPLDSRQNLM